MEITYMHYKETIKVNDKQTLNVVLFIPSFSYYDFISKSKRIVFYSKSCVI